jgi:hypothetical protein
MSPAAEKPARPSTAPESPRAQASPAALAAWDARLKTRLREALQGGRKPRFAFAALGGEVQATDLDAGDRLKTTGGGVSAQVPWGALEMPDRRALAAALAESEAPEDLSLAAFYALAAGEPVSAEGWLRRLPAPQADEVRAAFR